MTRKILKRFINDIKLSVSPVPSRPYWERVFQIFPEAREKYQMFFLELGEDAKGTLDRWDVTRNRIIQDFKDNPKYKSLVSGDMSKYVISPLSGVANKSIFELEANTLGGCYLSIDLKSANFQALREVGVYNDPDWKTLLSKYTDSKHLQSSKYFRSVVYGNLNVGRIQTVEKFMINRVRQFLEDKKLLPENYKLISMMPDELIYEIQYNDIDLEGDIRSIIEIELGLQTKVSQFQLQHYYLQSKNNPDRKIKFFGKLDLDTKCEEICGLGVPYYLLGIVLHRGLEVTTYDLTFLNQEGYECRLVDDFEIKRGI